MILLLFAAPFIFGEVDQSTVGHACAGYFITDMYLELGIDRNSSMPERDARAFCLAYAIGWTKEMCDKRQDGTDLLAVITGSVFNITFDWLFNRPKTKTQSRAAIKQGCGCKKRG